MYVFKTDDLGRGYGSLLEEVKSFGDEVSPRGMISREFRPLVVQLTDPARCVVGRRKFSHAFMWLEIAQLISGTYQPELIKAVSPNAARLINAYGAYGPRVKEQMLEVEEELRRAPDSRRCVVYVGRPDDLRYSKGYDVEHLDMPCTLTWQFLRRHERLDMIVNMRSWDLVWGLSYDVPMFASMQMALAASLNLDVGDYVHMAGSGHLYERHYGMKTQYNDEVLPCVADVGMPFGTVQDQAREALMAARWVLEDSGTQYLRRELAPVWREPFLMWVKAFPQYNKGDETEQCL